MLHVDGQSVADIQQQLGKLGRPWLEITPVEEGFRLKFTRSDEHFMRVLPGKEAIALVGSLMREAHNLAVQVRKEREARRRQGIIQQIKEAEATLDALRRELGE